MKMSLPYVKITLKIDLLLSLTRKNWTVDPSDHITEPLQSICPNVVRGGHTITEMMSVVIVTV